MEFKGHFMLHYSRGVKRQQGFTTGVEFYPYNILGLSPRMDHNGVVVNTPETQFNGLRLLPGRGEYNFLSDVDIVNLLLKNNGGETEGLILLFL